MQATQVTVYQPSNDSVLANTLNGLEEQFIATARRNVEASMDVSAYTAAEIEAVTRIEALRMVNGMDLAAMNIRYRLYRDIRDRALYTVDPRGFQSLPEMANEVGISISQLDNIIDLFETVFPWLQENLGVSIPTLFENVGLSNLRELIPTLKVIITGQPSGSRNVNTAVERMLDDAAATFVRVSVWREAAERLNNAGLHKGDVVQVTWDSADMDAQAYLPKDGGDPRGSLEITASSVKWIAKDANGEHEEAVSETAEEIPF